MQKISVRMILVILGLWLSTMAVAVAENPNIGYLKMYTRGALHTSGKVHKTSCTGVLLVGKSGFGFVLTSAYCVGPEPIHIEYDFFEFIRNGGANDHKIFASTKACVQLVNFSNKNYLSEKLALIKLPYRFNLKDGAVLGLGSEGKNKVYGGRVMDVDIKNNFSEEMPPLDFRGAPILSKTAVTGMYVGPYTKSKRDEPRPFFLVFNQQELDEKTHLTLLNSINSTMFLLSDKKCR